jgi:hypothetical protein
MEYLIPVDPKAVKDGGGEIFRSEGFGFRQSCMSIGATDNPAGLDSTSRKEAGKDVAPVMPAWRKDFAGRVAASLSNRGNPRRAAHLAAHHHQCFIEQSAVRKVIQKTA